MRAIGASTRVDFAPPHLCPPSSEIQRGKDNHDEGKNIRPTAPHFSVVLALDAFGFETFIDIKPARVYICLAGNAVEVFILLQDFAVKFLILAQSLFTDTTSSSHIITFFLRGNVEILT